MDPITRNLSMGAAGSEGIPAIGSFYQGGYLAGFISHTANGVRTHALIVAPRESGYNTGANLAWDSTQNFSNWGSLSLFDGASNMPFLVGSQFQAANFCRNLNIGGYSDWYLPSRFELQIAYMNLKPNGFPNATDTGSNIYAVPPRNSNYTASDPAQTSLAAFQEGGAQAFTASTANNGDVHWVSSPWNVSNTTSAAVRFLSGAFPNSTSTNKLPVRAMRKVAI